MKMMKDGAELFPNALSRHELSLLASMARRYDQKTAGVRLAHDETLSQILAPTNSLQTIAKSFLGNEVRPVRAILFDKQPGANWALGWHQDRTIAVKKRVETPGFGPWSVKSGINHVEPPFSLIEEMVTLRAHLDDCSNDNAPLLILRGSHKVGRVPIQEIEHLVTRSNSSACVAGPRDIWAYATSIIHASESAKNPTHRRVLQVDYSRSPLPQGLEWFGVR